LRIRRIKFNRSISYLMEWHEMDKDFYNLDVNGLIPKLKIDSLNLVL